jgi:predicted RNase H-like HicB family nuclease
MPTMTTATSQTSESLAREKLTKPYARRLVPQPEGGFTASIHELPGCFAEGEDAEEAMHALERAAHAWLVAAIDTGRPVPEPLDSDEYSGKIALRLSRTIHKMAAERAAFEGVSVNSLLATAIASYLGQVDGMAAATGSLGAGDGRVG